MDKKYYNTLFKKILNETLEEKANSLVNKLKERKRHNSDDVEDEFDDVLGIKDYKRKKRYSRDKDYKAFKDADKHIKKHFNKPADPVYDHLPSELWRGHSLPYDIDTSSSFGEFAEGNKKNICNECGVGVMLEGECNECGYKKMSMEETKKLTKGQKYIAKQAEPKDKIDAEDFKKLRSKKRKEKMEETVYRIYSGNESALFTENEVIDIIEEFVNEEKFKKGEKPPGYTNYEKAHKGSKTENDKYIKSVLKKIEEYTKPGSKTKYDMNPENFPKGNGEFKEMDKKAYSTTEEGTKYNYEYGGLNIPDFDEPLPDKKRFKKQIEGSSENGNEQGIGNSVKTDVNSMFADIFDKDPLGDAKDQAYNRADQPVSLSNKEKKKLKEDFSRIKELITYKDKTQ